MVRAKFLKSRSFMGGQLVEFRSFGPISLSIRVLISNVLTNDFFKEGRIADLPKVLELLHRGPSTYETLHSKGSEWTHYLRQEAALRAVRRVGTVVTSRRSAGLDLQESTLWWQLWVRHPAHARAEFERPHDQAMTVVRNGNALWTALSSGVQYVSDHDELLSGLGPAQSLTDTPGLLGSLALCVRGRTRFLGRRAYIVSGSPRISHGRVGRKGPIGLGYGANDYELIVDAERGIVLRSEARFEGSAFRILETTSLAFDEDLSDDLFAPAPPLGGR